MKLLPTGVKVHLAYGYTDMMTWTPPSTDASVEHLHLTEGD